MSQEEFLEAEPKPIFDEHTDLIDEDHLVVLLCAICGMIFTFILTFVGLSMGNIKQIERNTARSIEFEHFIPIGSSHHWCYKSGLLVIYNQKETYVLFLVSIFDCGIFHEQDAMRLVPCGTSLHVLMHDDRLDWSISPFLYQRFGRRYLRLRIPNRLSWLPIFQF